MAIILSKFKPKNIILTTMTCCLLSSFSFADQCPTVWNMQGRLINSTHTLNFNWERNNHWFFAEIHGPFNLKIADVIGNEHQAIWSTFISEKQTPSKKLLKKIMGQPFPITDFFNILCGQPSQILNTTHQNQEVNYSNATVVVTAKDFTPVDMYQLPLEIIIHHTNDQTSLLIDQLEVGRTPSISSAVAQLQIKRIKALPPSPAP